MGYKKGGASKTYKNELKLGSLVESKLRTIRYNKVI